MSKILLIEDDKVLLDMYKYKFAKEGFDVETALNGKEGVEKMKTFLPDIVLLDLIMPKISGFEVLKMVKEDKDINKIPIIVLTNIYADAEDLVKNWGVEHFMPKSDYTPENIVEKVKNVVQFKAKAVPQK